MDLKPILKNGTYTIEKFDEVLAKVNEFIKSVMDTQPVEIHDKDTLKVVKDARTEIRARKEEITKARIQINEIYFGVFNGQLKEIEKALKEADDKLKANVDAYNEKIGNVKPKMLKIEIGSYDANVLNQVREIAIKLNCQVKDK